MKTILYLPSDLTEIYLMQRAWPPKIGVRSKLNYFSIIEVLLWHTNCRILSKVRSKFDIAGTTIQMRLQLFWLIKRPFQIPVAHFDQNRTIRYQF